MSSARVLHILSPQMPGPVMPVDVAMQLYMAHSPPLRRFLSSYESCRSRNLVTACCKPLRPCLSSKVSLEPPRLDWPTPKERTKKRVAFADSKGMSLTAVHVFSVGEDDPSVSQLQYDLAKLESAMATLRVSSAQSWILDFPQPAVDYLDFRSRLLKNSVSLENCVLQERSLTGTIKVKNVAFEKSVQVRITFDTWKSHQDIECTFMNNVYGCQDTDSFSFAIELPNYVQPQNRVEFCIQYKTGVQTFWDNNDGQNYGLVTAMNNQGKELNSQTQHNKTSPPPKPGKRVETELDQLSCSRTSTGHLPKLHSWGCVTTSVSFW